jgi:flavin reductase (DIM6/NTAB) family NADH-FMN oxidoreductase RutF
MSPTRQARAPAASRREPPCVTHDALRRLLRRQATTVAVITAAGDGRPVGFTATTFTRVSMRPPLVSFCLHRESSSWPTFEAAEHVAVHLLRAGQVEVARAFATRGIDRFARTGWRPGPYQLPLLDNALAWLVCRVADRIAAGDHAIVLAEPLTAEYADGVPLIYHDGRYSGPGDDPLPAGAG